MQIKKQIVVLIKTAKIEQILFVNLKFLCYLKLNHIIVFLVLRFVILYFSVQTDSMKLKV